MRKFSPMKSLQQMLGDISSRTNAAHFLRSNIHEKKLNGGVSFQKVVLVTFVLAAALICGFLYNNQPQKAYAANCRWTGSVGNADWMTAGNWTSCASLVPQSGDSITFDSSGTQVVNLNSSTSIANLTIANTFAGTITVGGGYTLTVSTNYRQYAGTFNAPAAGSIRVGNQFMNDQGVFNASTSLVDLYNVTNAGSAGFWGNTTFYDLSITSPTATPVLFEQTRTQTVLHNFVAKGTSSQNLILTRNAGSNWILDLKGTYSMEYVSVSYSTSLRAGYLNPPNSFNGPSNTGWFPPINVSGSCSSTSAETVYLVVNGTLNTQFATTAGGAPCTYTISGVYRPNKGDVIQTFVNKIGASDPTDAQKAVAVMKYNTAGNDVTGLDLREKTLSIGTLDSQVVTYSDLKMYDYVNTTTRKNILYDCTDAYGPNNFFNLMSKASGYSQQLTVYIPNGGTYSGQTSGYRVVTETDYLQIATGGTYLGANDSTMDLKATGTPFTKSGTFDPGTSNFIYSAAVTVTAATYYDLTLLGTGSDTVLAAGTLTALRNFTIGNGTATTVVRANTNNPIINIGDSLARPTFLISNASTFYASPSAVMNVYGSFTAHGTFTHNNGTVNIFLSTGDHGHITADNAPVSKFYNLNITRGATATVAYKIYFDTNFTVDGNLTMRNDTDVRLYIESKTASIGTISVTGDIIFPATPANTGGISIGDNISRDSNGNPIYASWPSIDFKGNFRQLDTDVNPGGSSIVIAGYLTASGSTNQHFERARSTYNAGTAYQPSFLSGDLSSVTWKINKPVAGTFVIPDSDFVFDNVVCDANYDAEFQKNGTNTIALNNFNYGSDCNFTQPNDADMFLLFGNFTMNAAGKTFSINPTFKTQFGYLLSKFFYVSDFVNDETWSKGDVVINNGTLTFPTAYATKMRSLTMNAGNFNAPGGTGELIMYSNFTIGAGATFHNNLGKVKFLTDYIGSYITVANSAASTFYTLDFGRTLTTKRIDYTGNWAGGIEIRSALVVDSNFQIYNSSESPLNISKINSADALPVTINGNFTLLHTDETGAIGIGNSNVPATFPTFDLNRDFSYEENTDTAGDAKVYLCMKFIVSGTVDQHFTRLRTLYPYGVTPDYLAGYFVNVTWQFRMGAGAHVIADTDFIFNGVVCDANYRAEFLKKNSNKIALTNFQYNNGCNFIQPLDAVDSFLWFGDFTMNANSTFTINPLFKTQFGFMRSKFGISFVGNQTYPERWSGDSLPYYFDTGTNGNITVNNGTLEFPTGYVTTAGGVTINGGVLKAPGGAGNLSVHYNFVQTGGSFVHQNGLVTLLADYANNTVSSINNLLTFYKLDITKYLGDTFSILLKSNIQTDSDLTFGNRMTSLINYPLNHLIFRSESSLNPTVTVKGNFILPDYGNRNCSTFGATTYPNQLNVDLWGDLSAPATNAVVLDANFHFVGDREQQIDVNAHLENDDTWKGVWLSNGKWEINKSSASGKVSLAKNFIASSVHGIIDNNNGHPLYMDVKKGVLDMNGKNFVLLGRTNDFIDGSGGFANLVDVTLSAQDAGTIRLLGTEQTPRFVVLSRFSTVEYYDQNANGREIKKWNYGNLKINAVNGVTKGKYSLPASLVGYWKMDESSWSGIGSVKDSTILANNGTAANGAAPVTGKYGNSGSFNYSMNSLVDAGSIPNVDLTNEVTVSTWVNFDSFPCDQAQGFFSKDHDLTLYATCRSYNAVTNFPPRYSFVFSTPGGLVGSQFAAPVTGNWYHVVGVYKQYEYMKIYVNGVLSSTTPITTKRSETASNFRIGRGYSERVDCVGFGSASCDSWNNVDTLSGRLDEARLYSVALTDQQIANLYNNNDAGPLPGTNIQNDVSIVAGTLDGQGREASVGGNWTNQDTFLSKDGKVTFTSADKTDFVNSIGTTIPAIKLLNNNNQQWGSVGFDSGISDGGQWKFVDTNNHIILQNNLYVANGNVATDAADLDNKQMTVMGDVVLTGGKLTARGSVINVGGNWSNTGGTGVLAYGTSTVKFTKADGPQNISGNTTFYNLTKQVSTEQHWIFAKDSVTSVMGKWTATGTQNNILFVEKDGVANNGDHWKIWLNNVSSGKDLQWLAVRDSNNISVQEINVAADKVYDLGNNIRWIFGGIDISGSCNLYDEAVTTFCAPGANIVSVAVNDEIQPMKGSIAADGTWSVSGILGKAAGATITVYLDGVAIEKRANLVAVSNATNIINAKLFENHLTIGAEGSAMINNGNLALFGHSIAADDDIIFDINVSSKKLTLLNTGKVLRDEVLYVGGNNSSLYQPKFGTMTGDLITAPSVHIGPSAKMDLSNCTDIDACKINVDGGNWRNDLTGSFAAGSSTVNFSGTANDQEIKTGNAASKFDKSVINGTIQTNSWVSPDINPYQYQKEITINGPYSAGGSPSATLSNGLVAEYKMNEASWTTNGPVLDSTTNGANGINTRANTTDTGKFGRGGDFNATNTSYVALPAAVTSGLNKFTISMWVNETQAGPVNDDRTLIGNFSTSNEGSLRVTSRGGRLGMLASKMNSSYLNTANTFDGTGVSSTGTYSISNNKWNHVVVVADGMQISLYANSEADGKMIHLGSSPADRGLTALSMYLGAQNYNNSIPAASYYTGKIDDVRIYNRALSDAEIGILDQASEDNSFDVNKLNLVDYKAVLDDGEVARYDFEDQANVGKDVSGNSNNGVPTGDITAFGKFGNGLKFTADGQNLSLGKPSIPGPGSEFSVSTWFYQSAYAFSSQYLVSQTDSAGSGFSIFTGVADTSGNYDDILVGDATNDATVWKVPVLFSVGSGAWHHVVVVSKKNGADLYFDGILKASKTSALSYGNNSDSLVLGKKNLTVSGGDLKGGLDEFRIYDRLLTSSDVSTLHTSNTTSDWANFYTHALETGQDIIFTASDKTTLLPFYRDKFTASGQNSRFVVKVPSVPANSSTNIYAYYGNTHSDRSDASLITSALPAPKGAWSLDEGVGTTAKDATANANNCSVVAPPDSWTGSGKSGAALVGGNTTLNWNTWNYALCGNGASINSISGAITLEAWVNMAFPVSQNVSGSILYRENSYDLGISSTYTDSINIDRYKFSLYTSSGWKTIYSDFTATPGKWQHVVATWDNGSKIMKLYVDGVLRASGSEYVANSLAASSSVFSIGVGLYQNYDRLQGQIDDARVYNVALDPAQIALDAISKPFYSLNSVAPVATNTAYAPSILFSDTEATWQAESNGTWITSDDFHANTLTLGDGGLNAGVGDVHIYSDFSQVQGTKTSKFTAPGANKTMYVGGNFTHTSGQFITNGGTLAFNSKASDVKNIKLNGISPDNLAFDSETTNRGQWKFADTDTAVAVANDFTLGKTVTTTAGLGSAPITTRYIWYPDGAQGMIKQDTVTGIKTSVPVLPGGGLFNVHGSSVDKDGNAWLSFDNYPVTGWNGYQSIRIDAVTNQITKYPSGGGPIVVDSAGNIWMSQASSTNYLIKYNSAGTEVCRGTTSYHANAMAADSNGNIWVAGNNQYGMDELLKFDQSCTQKVIGDSSSQPLGIAVDSDNNVWVTSSLEGVVRKINGNTGATMAIVSTENGYPVGVAIDANNDVWVANDSSYGTVVKISHTTNTVVKTVDVSAGPYGISISGDGKVWTTHLGSNNTTKIDPVTDTVTNYPASGAVFTVGDMTGFALQKFVLKNDTQVALGLDLQGKTLTTKNVKIIDTGRITVSEPSSVIVSGDWQNNADAETFKDATGSAKPLWVANFNGTSQRILGNTVFSTLKSTNFTATFREIAFGAGTTTEVTKYLDIEGKSSSARSITLKSTATGNKWNIKVSSILTPNHLVDSVNLYDSNNTNSVYLCASNSNGSTTDNIRWNITAISSAPGVCGLPISIVISGKDRVKVGETFSLDWAVEEADSCDFTSNPVNASWNTARTIPPADVHDWTGSVPLAISNTTTFTMTCKNSSNPGGVVKTKTVSINGGICTFNDNNTVNAMLFCENAFNLKGDNSTFNGAVSSQNMSIDGATQNNRFNYEYDTDGNAPPGFRYLNIPRPSEVGNKQ
ncbi:MAG: DUF2341 domain-containing protein [Candidatus Berkelbacteria bacterium]